MPAATPSRAGSRARTFAPNWVVTPPNPRSSTWAQFCPYRCGVPTRPIRLAPKTRAASPDATATVVPTRALRTGTAVRPWPGSKAIRTPIPPVTDPAPPSSEPTRETRLTLVGSARPSGPRARPAAPQAAGTSTASGTRAKMANPAARTARLTSTPGAGSARRAAPIGMSGEAAMAMPTATSPPAPVITAVRTRDSVTRAPRVMPRARKTGNSAASRVSWRLSNCTMTASAMSPARPANSASATASGRMARWVAATPSDRLMMSIFPPLAGYRFASAAAAATKRPCPRPAGAGCPPGSRTCPAAPRRWP